jgi:hypothetical protein
MPAKIAGRDRKRYRRECNRFFHNDLTYHLSLDVVRIRSKFGCLIGCERMLTHFRL